MILKRLIKGTQDYLKRVQNPYPEAQQTLFQFSSPADLALWNIFSDAEYGGKSTAELRLSEEVPGSAELCGQFSTQVADEGAHERLKRSGFCGIHSKARVVEIKGYLDLEDFDTLVFRVRGDGRKYLANLRTENWIVGERSHDVWQAFLFAREGEWTDVEIPLDRFLLTWRGKLVETRVEMNPKRILSLGISLAGGADLQPDGSFRLGLRAILARNSSVIMSSAQLKQRLEEESRR
ncbi:hypothetical protein N2152v2_004377 [Parachlorella kessleri]